MKKLRNPHAELAEDLDSDTNLLTRDRQSPLAGSFVQPQYTFRGQEVWPLTHGSDLLFRQLQHLCDNGLTAALKFVFVHVKRDGATMEDDMQRHVMPLAWQSTPQIHAALLSWVQENIRSDADKIEALRLFDEMTSAADETEPIVSGSKKNSTAAVKRRRKRRS